MLKKFMNSKTAQSAVTSQYLRFWFIKSTQRDFIRWTLQFAILSNTKFHQSFQRTVYKRGKVKLLYMYISQRFLKILQKTIFRKR